MLASLTWEGVVTCPPFFHKTPRNIANSVIVVAFFYFSIDIHEPTKTILINTKELTITYGRVEIGETT